MIKRYFSVDIVVELGENKALASTLEIRDDLECLGTAMPVDFVCGVEVKRITELQEDLETIVEEWPEPQSSNS